jgi:hypothetical protein
MSSADPIDVGPPTPASGNTLRRGRSSADRLADTSEPALHEDSDVRSEKPQANPEDQKARKPQDTDPTQEQDPKGTVRQSRDMDCPARSGAYAASLRDTNSVKSRTRFVLRVSPCVRSQSVPYMCRSLPGTLTSRGSASPTKHGSVVIPSPCRTATICAPASVVLN